MAIADLLKEAANRDLAASAGLFFEVQRRCLRELPRHHFEDCVPLFIAASIAWTLADKLGEDDAVEAATMPSWSECANRLSAIVRTIGDRSADRSRLIASAELVAVLYPGPRHN